MRAPSVFSGIWTRRNLTMALTFIVVVAAGLVLLGTGLLQGKQADRTRSQGRAEMAIYFCIKTSPSRICTQNGPATKAEKDQLLRRLEAMPQVQSVRYVSQAQEYQNFRQEFADDPNLVNHTPSGAIPDSLEVGLENPGSDYHVVARTANGAPGVDIVVNEMDNPRQPAG